MKKILFTLISISFFSSLFAQWATSGNDIYNTNTGNVGIGTMAPGSYSKLNVVGGALEISAYSHQADASLHISTSFGQYGRLTQINSSAVNSHALNLMASADINGNLNWWSWGVLSSGTWALQPSTGFGGSTGLFIDRNGGKLGIGTPSPSARLDVHTSTSLGGVAGNNQLLTRVSGISNNYFMNNLWLTRDNSGLSDWLSARLHDGISIDGSFLTPGSDTRTWWERAPFQDIQQWGNANQTYMTLYAGKLGLGTIAPSEALDVPRIFQYLRRQ